MKTQRCRVCKQEIGLFGFNQHTLKHKREFCKIIGRIEGEAWKINWEDVVLYYNPLEANEKKCIGYPNTKFERKTLKDFV